MDFNFHSQNIQEGLTYRTVEDLAQHMRWPGSLIHLLMDLGMATDDEGRACAIVACGWLRDNRDKIRQMGTLPPLEMPEGLTETSQWMWQACAAHLTLSEYCASRTSDPETRAFWYGVAADTRDQMNRLTEKEDRE